MTLGEFLVAIFEYLYGYWPFRIVQQWEQGIRLRFGKVTASLGPGLHMFWPAFGEILTATAGVVDVNQTGSQTVEDSGGVPVTFSIVFKYRLLDLRRMYTQLQDHDDSVVNEIVGSAASLIATMDGDDLAEELPEAVYSDLVGRLEEWGVELLGIQFADFCRAGTLRLLMSGE